MKKKVIGLLIVCFLLSSVNVFAETNEERVQPSDSPYEVVITPIANSDYDILSIPEKKTSKEFNCEIKDKQTGKVLSRTIVTVTGWYSTYDKSSEIESIKSRTTYGQRFPSMSLIGNEAGSQNYGVIVYYDDDNNAIAAFKYSINYNGVITTW